MKNLSRDNKAKALDYIGVLVDVAREPFLILDKDLLVIKANGSFYQTFKVVKEDTEERFIYDLGNKQWNISKLKELLEGIMPNKKVFKDFEVEYNFPAIGQRTMLLNARQIDSVGLIILCFEDITAQRAVEEKAREYTEKLENEVAKRTEDLNSRVKDLEELTQVMVGRELKMSELKKEISRIKKLKKVNGNNGNGHTLS